MRLTVAGFSCAKKIQCPVTDLLIYSTTTSYSHTHSDQDKFTQITARESLD